MQSISVSYVKCIVYVFNKVYKEFQITKYFHFAQIFFVQTITFAGISDERSI